MTDKPCKMCGKPASHWTVFGMNLGNYCNRCYREANQRMRQTMEPFRRVVRDSFDKFCEENTSEQSLDKLAVRDATPSDAAAMAVADASGK